MNTLELSDKIAKDENKQMRPKFAQIGSAYGLPKFHNQFFKVLSFRPIFDKTNTPYYGVDKSLINLLNPLTQNEYTVKDSFEAVSTIHKNPPELLIKAIVVLFCFLVVFFDVILLSANVPLDKTINIILELIYKEKLVNTKL